MRTKNDVYELLVKAQQREPFCERCGRRKAEYVTTTENEYPQANNNKWAFRCRKCTPKAGDCYCFTIVDLLRSGEEFIDWMKHLAGKRWFDELDFSWMLARFAIAGPARPRLKGVPPA